MSKIKSLAIKGTAGLASIMALASSALAYSYDYSYGTNDDAFAAMFGGAFWIVWCCVIILSLAFSAFWIWMFIDLLKRTEAEVPNKTVWIIVMLFVSASALVYFFVVKKKLDAKK